MCWNGYTNREEFDDQHQHRAFPFSVTTTHTASPKPKQEGNPSPHNPKRQGDIINLISEQPHERGRFTALKPTHQSATATVNHNPRTTNAKNPSETDKHARPRTSNNSRGKGGGKNKKGIGMCERQGQKEMSQEEGNERNKS